MTADREEPGDAGTQRFFDLAHQTFEILLGDRHPGDRDGAPMGAHINTQDLKLAIFGLRIGPIQGEIDLARTR